MRSALTRVGADAVGAVIDRVLAHQEQRRGLGQAVGAEVRPRIHRLLRDVEQQAAAGALRQHDLHRGLRDALVAEEIQLEALAQHRLVDLADAALPGRAGVRDDDVDAAERLDDLVEGRAHRRGVGDVAGDRRAPSPPIALACFARPRQIDIEQRDLGAGRGERLGGGGADRAARAGDRPRPGRRAAARLRLAELGLLDRPVFDVEHVGFGDRLEAADRLGVGDGLRSRPRRDRRRSRASFADAAEAEQAEPRHQHDAGQRIEHRLAAADARVVAREIVLVARR